MPKKTSSTTSDRNISTFHLLNFFYFNYQSALTAWSFTTCFWETFRQLGVAYLLPGYWIREFHHDHTIMIMIVCLQSFDLFFIKFFIHRLFDCLRGSVNFCHFACVLSLYFFGRKSARRRDYGWRSLGVLNFIGFYFFYFFLLVCLICPLLSI